MKHIFVKDGIHEVKEWDELKPFLTGEAVETVVNTIENLTCKQEGEWEGETPKIDVPLEAVVIYEGVFYYPTSFTEDNESLEFINYEPLKII